MSLQDSLAYKIVTILNNIHSIIPKEELKKLNITYANYVTLLFIYENPGITQTELSRINHKDKNFIRLNIDKFEKLGYVTRKSLETDRRVNKLYLTKKGESIIEKHGNIIINGQNKLFEKITKEEQEKLFEILNKLI